MAADRVRIYTVAELERVATDYLALGEWPAEVYKHVERSLESGGDTLL
jgi:hypothetical protein